LIPSKPWWYRRIICLQEAQTIPLNSGSWTVLRILKHLQVRVFFCQQIGHTDGVMALFLQDINLYSTSNDCSAKMWTIIRGVELKYFKDFDDNPTSVQKSGLVVFATISNMITAVDQTTRTFQKILSSNMIIEGSLKRHSTLFVISSNITLISVKQYQLPQLETSFNEDGQTVKITDSCSSFYINNLNNNIFFGLRDGSILQFSTETKSFSAMVNHY
jgi:hypothetical protein